MYEEFDSNIDDDDKNKHSYSTLCGYYDGGIFGGKISKYKDTCMKLIRNLGFIKVDPLYFNYNYNRCNILYNWIYNSKKKDKITDDIIKNCYNDYVGAKETIKDNLKCIYHSYDDEYIAPENIMLLNVFDFHIDAARDTMNGVNNDLKLSCLKYICEFVNIYNKMNSKYCQGADPSDQKQRNTCQYLSTFKQKYNIFYNTLKENDKIPYIDDGNTEYMNKCKLDEKSPTFPAVVQDDKSQYSHLGRDIQDGPYPYPSQPTDSKPDQKNSMSSTISTTVGTVAGASSVLALLYKFTPGRKWIHSGFGGRRARIGSNLYEEGASKLLYNGPEREDFSSYNQRYDIGYSPV
ncbi:Plasmodium vivax Vir protein, putative [Plasmodium vivax]|uniref:Vir protein, putative n=1 Tax=Plasmodium vivax TaxID=5855 RepID=A0A1G4HDN9_PLAVI|nr:Plasmodium vivax Vir protein, putative [Plasmodium vivax]